VGAVLTVGDVLHRGHPPGGVRAATFRTLATRNRRRIFVPVKAGALLQQVTLTRADLSRANLGVWAFGGGGQSASLYSARARQANFQNANLYSANLQFTDLSGANLAGANVSQVMWLNTTCPDNTVTSWSCPT
jgi:uncharacterized protein YjbI with pentapeptide repeats